MPRECLEAPARRNSCGHAASDGDRVDKRMKPSGTTAVPSEFFRNNFFRKREGGAIIVEDGASFRSNPGTAAAGGAD
jgi:hypothetical protein